MTTAVRIEGQMTLEDFREFVSTTPGKAPPRPWVSFLYSLMSPIFLGWFALPGLRPMGAWQAMQQSSFPQQNLWITVLPMLMLVTQAVMPKLLATVPQSGQRAGKMFGGCVPFAWLFCIEIPAASIAWQPSPGQLIAAAFLPWTVYVSFIQLRNIPTFYNRRIIKRWNAAPSIRRPFTGEVNDDAVIVDDGVVYHRYQWRHFSRYLETDNLLIVYTVNNQATLVPKSRMDLGTLAAIRTLLQAHIAKGKLLTQPTGFDTLPVPVIEIA